MWVGRPSRNLEYWWPSKIEKEGDAELEAPVVIVYLLGNLLDSSGPPPSRV